MADTPTQEPKSFVAGETVEWQKTLDDYSAADGWALKYFFRGAGKFDLVAAAQPDGSFRVTISAEIVTQPGAYYWQARVERDDERRVVATGRCVVIEDLSGAVEAYDGRSDARRALDAIDAMLEGKATYDQQEYSIDTGAGSRSLKRIPIADLLQLRKSYARLVAREQRSARVRRGGSLFRNVKSRFKRP